MELKNKKILAIGAHPDDVEYYAGGTLLRLAPDNQIFLAVATNGENGGELMVRKKEQQKAARLFSASILFLNFPDMGLKNNFRLVKILTETILKIEPDVVLSFDPERQFQAHPDWHPDHRALSLATMDALLYMTIPKYRQSLGFVRKVGRPEVWLFNPQQPDFFIDIAAFWEEKQKLLEVFVSQSLDLGLAKKEAKQTGDLIGKTMAEGFKRW